MKCENAESKTDVHLEKNKSRAQYFRTQLSCKTKGFLIPLGESCTK